MTEFRNGYPTISTGIPDGLYYTTKEFADEMDVPEGTVRVWIRRGQITYVNCFGRNYIPKDAVVVFTKKSGRTQNNRTMAVTK